jgi:hypothetical protein
MKRLAGHPRFGVLVFLILQIALNHLVILTPLFRVLVLSGLLSLIFLGFIFGVHTWNTPFISIRHHPEQKCERAIR